MLERRLEDAFTSNRDRIAVAAEDGTWTYDELQRFADRVVGCLQCRGIRAGRPVALLFDHGAAMIAAMLGALRAGAAYVPLDPLWPKVRLETIIGGLRPRLLLACDRYAAVAGEIAPPLDVVCARDLLRYPPWSGWPPRIAPDTPAYILHTSGSTGRPRAVVQSRHGLLAHSQVYADSIAIARSDRVSLLASYTSDASVMDIYVALLNGASLYIFDPRGDRLPAVARWLSTARISVLHCTPTLLRAILRTDAAGGLSYAVRLAVLGGEPLHRRDVYTFWRIFGRGVPLINGLGPTECTLALQQRISEPGDLRSHEIVPVGRPVPGVRVQLLPTPGDDFSHELVLESDALAMPLSGGGTLASPAARPQHHRTGDLVQIASDGRLVWVGRTDGAIKRGGVLVRAEEVEAALASIEGLAEVAVVIGEVEGRAKLAAFYVVMSGSRLSRAQVRRAAAANLPSAMVPDSFTELGDLPRTTTNKIDRQALCAIASCPERQQPIGNGDPCARIAEVFGQVLGQPVYDPATDFFAAGGDSIAALEATLQLDAALGTEVPIEWIFDDARPLALAKRLMARWPKAPAVAWIKPGSFDGAELSAAQKRYWARCARAGDDGGLDIRLRMIIRGPLDVARFEQAWICTMRAHDVFSLQFDGSGAVPRQKPAGHWVGLEIAGAPRCAIALGGGVTQADLIASRRNFWRPFRLEIGPLARALLVALAPWQHVLYLHIHHLIMDVWSRMLFEQRLFQDYHDLLHGRTATAMAYEPVCYLSCLHARSAQLPLAMHELQLEVWRDLAAALPAWDRAVGARFGSAAGAAPARSQGFQVDCAEWENFCRTCGVSAFGAAAALVALTLARWLGVPEVLLTTDAASRHLANRAVIGLFSDVRVLHAVPAGGASFPEFVRTMTSTVGAQLSADALPFADVVEAMYPGELQDYHRRYPVAVFYEQASSWHCWGGGIFTLTEELGSKTTSRPMIVTFASHPDRLDVTLTYGCDVVADGAAGAFVDLLKAALARDANVRA